MKAKKDKIGGFIIEKISQTKTVYQGNGPKDKIEKFKSYLINYGAKMDNSTVPNIEPISKNKCFDDYGIQCTDPKWHRKGSSGQPSPIHNAFNKTFDSPTEREKRDKLLGDFSSKAWHIMMAKMQPGIFSLVYQKVRSVVSDNQKKAEDRRLAASTKSQLSNKPLHSRKVPAPQEEHESEENKGDLQSYLERENYRLKHELQKAQADYQLKYEAKVKKMNEELEEKVKKMKKELEEESEEKVKKLKGKFKIIAQELLPILNPNGTNAISSQLIEKIIDL